MSNQNYRRGANFERKVKKWYEDNLVGCFVLRSAGSHSPVDLVVLWNGGVALVQCKMDGKLPRDEEEKLIKIAKEQRCYAALAYKEGSVVEIQPLYPIKTARKEVHEEEPRA